MSFPDGGLLLRNDIDRIREKIAAERHYFAKCTKAEDNFERSIFS